MASEIIACPSCQHDVRVPESLFGQPVRCPNCKAYFVAPRREADGHLGAPQLLPEPPADALDVQPTSPRARRGADLPSLMLPAYFLLLVGVLGALVNGYDAYRTFADPDAAKKQMIDLQKQFAQMMNQPFDNNTAEKLADYLPTIRAVVFVVSLLPLLGAIAMLRRQGYYLAVLGSVIALINIGNCCCIIGLPVGIYCLVKLYDPDVQDLFRSSSPSV